MKSIVSVFDLDGCWVDDFHRRNLLPETGNQNNDYEAYHNAMIGDSTFPMAVELVHTAIREGHIIIFNTTRPVNYRKQSEDQILAWCGLEKHQYNLFMRNFHEEGLPSAKLKATKISSIMVMYPGHTVYCYDDRADVVEAYHKIGAQAYMLRGDKVLGGINKEVLIRYSANSILVNEYGKSHPKSGVDIVVAPVLSTMDQRMTATYEKHAPHHHCSLFDLLHMENRNTGVTNIIGEIVSSFGIRDLPPQQLNCRCYTGTIDFSNPIKLSDSIQSDLLKHDHSEFLKQFTVIKPEENPAYATEQLKDVLGILASAADTFKERHEIYGENSKVVGQILHALFPDGPDLSSPEAQELYMFVMHIVGKLTRFAASDMTHVDSVHDIITYAALAESMLKMESEDE